MENSCMVVQGQNEGAGVSHEQPGLSPTWCVGSSWHTQYLRWVERRGLLGVLEGWWSFRVRIFNFLKFYSSVKAEPRESSDFSIFQKLSVQLRMAAEVLKAEQSRWIWKKSCVLTKSGLCLEKSIFLRRPLQSVKFQSSTQLLLPSSLPEDTEERTTFYLDVNRLGINFCLARSSLSFFELACL